ncbi:MFS multidrug transporter, putative [Talaromyces stipitatus ATCC 10500]|uniref:MFS multidrug transporter, putative n=1 Tax=Talaromyces stipitatus (strain ATCC 10500 / CBS 375.48 / QM 6759 / NRRL 1006) TaxID=441959 RepID=B8M0T9_TALSN|nr:MFS multidrug transporter, putative [Talaromyces stipitatus ATCC 10500]EED21472.1 MFS multidrug transporter, putative [Talaromyces stipitatus ATCC 10500]
MAETVTPTRIPFWRKVIDQAGVTPEVANYTYPGSGTKEDPYIISWIPNDPRDPMRFSKTAKWGITMLVAVSTLAVALASSAYSGGILQTMLAFGISQEVATLGISLFVLGFAIGPLVWAPMSELFGRQILFTVTYCLLTVFSAGCTGSKNPQTLIILRFFAGAFGSSPLTNAGGVIADMFSASERGLATTFFAVAPFLGPVLGPIIGGFLGEYAGWKWVVGFIAIFAGVVWIIGTLLIPETYAPVLLRRRAAKLHKMTGKVYVTHIDVQRGHVSIQQALKASLLRPWILLLREPIVLLLSVYMAIIYGTLYMLFGAFPIVFEGTRHWSQGITGLSFLGVMVGMLFAVMYSIWDNKRYLREVEKQGGFAAPEARLPPCLVGCVALPVGLFWFAWTNYPSIHWIVCILAGVPFGFGMVLVFLGVMNYLIDAYTIFAASVLAANSVLRSLCGAAFPLFTTYMYHNLGIHWASSVPAFLALACVPFPFLFYKYGAQIREKCKYAAESIAFVRKMLQAAAAQDESTDGEKIEEPEFDRTEAPAPHDVSSESGDEEAEEEPARRMYSRASRASTRTATSSHRRFEYEGNPYDIDRVNTRDSDFSIIAPGKPVAMRRVVSDLLISAGRRPSNNLSSLRNRRTNGSNPSQQRRHNSNKSIDGPDSIPTKGSSGSTTSSTVSPPPTSATSATSPPLSVSRSRRSAWELIKSGPIGRFGDWYTNTQHKRPYVTQLASSLIIYLAGDLKMKTTESVDGGERETVATAGYDPLRTLRHLTVGLVSSIPSYKWFMFLHHNFNYTSKFRSIFTKVAVQQAVFTPVFNTYFFSMQSLLAGATIEETWERLKLAVPNSIKNSVKLWPAVTAFSFMYIPPHFRSVFGGMIAVGWQTYLSWLNQKAAREVAAAEAAASSGVEISAVRTADDRISQAA